MGNVHRSSHEVWLELEGGTVFELVGYTSNTSLNSIPSAQCMLAVGRNANDVSKVAAIHRPTGSLREMVKAKVYMKSSGAWDDNHDWPEEPVVIFEGRLTGIGYRKYNGQITYVANLIHWLADMAYSSTLSEQSHPANPGKYSYHAVFSSIGAGSRGNPNGLSALGGDTFFSGDRIRRDFWGEAIKPFFCKLTEQDTIQLRGELAGRAQAGLNDNAREALMKIEGASKDGCSLPLSDYNVPLSFDMDAGAGISLRIARAISQQIMRDTIESYATTTMWDVLVGRLSASFAFGVVPLAEKALIVPYVPGLRDTYDKEIDVNDYDYVDLSAYIPRPIKGVGIYSGRSMNSNPGGDPNAQGPRAVGIGGYFEPEDADKGMLLLRGGPAWLHNIPFTYSSAAKTSGVRSSVATSTGTTPVAGSSSIKGGDDDKTANEVAAQASTYYDLSLIHI